MGKNSNILRRHFTLDYIPQYKGYRGRTIHGMEAAQKSTRTYVGSSDRVEKWCTIIPSKDQNRLMDGNVESSWVKGQRQALRQQGRNAQYLLEVLHKEIMAEHIRESDLLTCSQKELDVTSYRVLQERAESADRIIHTIKEYGLFPRMEELEHVLYSLQHISSCIENVTIKESCSLTSSSRGKEKKKFRNSNVFDHQIHDLSGRRGEKGRIGNRKMGRIEVQAVSASPYAVRRPLHWK